MSVFSSFINCSEVPWGTSSHLGVEEADGGVNNGSLVLEDGDLEDVALVADYDSVELHSDVLGHGVEGKAEGQAPLLAGGHLDVVLDGRQVAHDALPGRGVLGLGLGGEQVARDKGDLDAALFVVVHLDDGVGRAAVDELNAQDVGVGEDGLDIGVEGRGVGGAEARLVSSSGCRVLLEARCQSNMASQCELAVA